MSEKESPQSPMRNPGQGATDFIKDRILPKYPNWDNASWDSWTPKDTADMVRAITNDYVHDHGDGHDWQESGNHAQFVMTGLFNDMVHFRAPNMPQGREFDFRMVMAWPGREEAFEAVLMRPTEHLLRPVPHSGGEFAHVYNSIVNQASVRCPAPMDCLKIPDEGILMLLDGLSGMLGSKDRVSLMFAAAMLARWKGCQVSQVVQGGAVYRQLKNPSFPNQPESDVRVLYARTGPHINRAFQSQGSHCNVVVLV
jgi:hypothetical protein